MGGRQSLLAEGGNGGIRSGPASEEMGVGGFEEGGNGGIRSGPGSEEMGGESWPMRFVRGGGGEVGGLVTGGVGEVGVHPSAAPWEEEEVLGGSEGWRMGGAMEGGTEMGGTGMGGTGMGGTGMEGTGMGGTEMGGMENGVGLPTYDYGLPTYVYGWGK